MIFVDANFIIATASAVDQWHDKAIKLLPKIKKEERITSEPIISEIITLVGKFHGAKAAINVYNYIKDTHLIYKDENLFDETIVEYLKYDATLSFADSTAVTIMKELNIQKIASFDSDFDRVDGIIRIH
ncbi:PIN domain-containing protein [Methanobrevibacter sp. TMH8]|uniref:type II toxin-antitoxin system VapC family toxin n=1 Tax=Methanobrevibacter sp. TMH8 TaxID=2848611 RepID=UPI001CC971AE|nr:PIN domain-containing protein [Methanobrevibacter sp. TMH8]MBZ9570085.1 PIN domain-containing protein [Methanobrevibacter sp. TMH8]